jgi:hypothetical protein
MSDYNSSLPVRTETNGDVASKIVDATTPSQGLAVESNGNAQVKVHGVDPGSVDRVLKLSELGNVNSDGLYDATNNTIPSSSGLVAFTRAASPALSDQVKKLTAISNSTVHALDVSLHDEAGAAFSDTNPLPVKLSDTEGTIIQDYKDATAIVVNGSDNHDYTVSAGKTLILTKVMGTASGKAKMEVQVESAAGSNSFATKWVKFNSTAEPNMSESFVDALQVATGVRVRVIMTNKDNQDQDLYSTIVGHEIP